MALPTILCNNVSIPPTFGVPQTISLISVFPATIPTTNPLSGHMSPLGSEVGDRIAVSGNVDQPELAGEIPDVLKTGRANIDEAAIHLMDLS